MDFLAIDFETANYKRTSCCAIGLVLFRDGVAQSNHYQLLRPYPFYMLPDHQAVHGIPIEAVADAQTFGEAWEGMKDIFEQEPYLVAHNAPFDMSVLRNSCAKYDIECPSLFYECSLAVSRRVWPKRKPSSMDDDCFSPTGVLTSHSLGIVAEYLGIELNHHEALSDANACGEIMVRAARELGVDSIPELQEKLKRPLRSLVDVPIAPETLVSSRPVKRRIVFSNKLSADTEAKLDDLRQKISDYGRLAIALSGGVDSSVLMAVASEVLGEKVVALTARSHSLNESEASDACGLACARKWHHEVVDFDEFAIPEFSQNPQNRCYYCKRHIFECLAKHAHDAGFTVLADGSNADDMQDFRPGVQALQELGVQSPMVAAGLCKREIRELAHYFGLPNADRASNSCPATRFPTGTPLTREALLRVVAGEQRLRKHFPDSVQLRLRDHGDIARIEINPPFDVLNNGPLRKNVIKELQELGYRYVTLDLEGYRSGNMNDTTNAK